MTLPSSAIPMPAPSWYEVSPIAAAPPARSAGTSLSIDSYAPNSVDWSPNPSSTNPAVSSTGRSCWPIRVSRSTEAAVRTKPQPTIRRGPTRLRVYEPVAPAAIAAKVSGRSRRPVSSGLRSRTSWRYWTAISSRPTRASMASTMQPTAVLKAGRENIAMSINGWVRRFCLRTKSTTSAAPTSRGTSVAGSVSPSRPPIRLIPRTTPSTPAAAISAPSTSQGPSLSPGTPAAASARPGGSAP